jgi:hypothetical protein
MDRLLRNRVGTATLAEGRSQGEERLRVRGGVGGARVPSLMGGLFRMIGIGAALGDVLEGDGAFDVLSGENGLVLPSHKDLDVRWHGEGRRVTMGTAGDRSFDRGNWRARRGGYSTAF